MKSDSSSASPKTCVAFVALAFAVSGCGVFGGGSGQRPEGFRLVEGRLAAPDDDLVGRQVTGLQVAALHLTADGGIAPFVSDVFDPTASAGEAAFVVAVENDKDFVLVLQVPSSSARGVGSFLGQLREGGTTLVPRGEDDIDVGTLTVEKGARVPADTTLTASSNNSIAGQVDSDGDGSVNNVDDDDDDDGSADGADADVAGDGVDDVKQLLETLPDDDGDGVADALGG